jgi:protein-S-isoprenylcysteine O-methyltransferase Ste14
MPLRTKIPPPIVFLAFALIAYGLSQVLPALAFPGRTIVALALALLGVASAAAAIVSFRRKQTTTNPLTPDQATFLVTTGVFRLTRNPMYLGLVLVLAGVSVWLGVWVGLVVLPAFVLYLTKFQIAPEEEAMAKLFGDAYADYRARVRRWI